MMQKISLWGLLLALILWSGCNRDGLQPGPDLDDNQVYLNYDGDKADAPQLSGGGFYEAAARFPASVMGDYQDNRLVGVAYFIEEEPRSASVRVYRGGDDEGPGELIYEADITDELKRRRWRTHELNPALSLAAEPLWIAIRFSHESDQRTLGCDPGPAASNGDWLYDSYDNGWIPLSQRSNGQIDINWNLRGVVQP